MTCGQQELRRRKPSVLNKAIAREEAACGGGIGAIITIVGVCCKNQTERARDDYKQHQHNLDTNDRTQFAVWAA
jgi:hypothetical protein